MKELYNYIENRCLLDPVNGKIPFKLHPYQKRILKAIHDNNTLIIVKCRQIGMTNLLAAYAAAISRMNYINIEYVSHNRISRKNFFKRLVGFGYITPPKNINCPTYFLYDEANFNRNLYDNDITDNMDSYRGDKFIFCGSVDKYGLMAGMIAGSPHWKHMIFPYSKCKDAFSFRNMKDIKDSIGKECWAREFECKGI
jgi:hypothetical protein